MWIWWLMKGLLLREPPCTSMFLLEQDGIFSWKTMEHLTEEDKAELFDAAGSVVMRGMPFCCEQ